MTTSNTLPQEQNSFRPAGDDFAAKVGATAEEAVLAVENAGIATADRLSSLACDAKTLAETSLDAVGKTVSRNPFAALAIAAGTGLLLGLACRHGGQK